MRDQRLDRAEVFRQQAEADRIHQLNARFGSSLELESQHAAGQRLLRLCECDLREAGKTGEVNTSDLGMLLQPFGNALRIGGVLLQTQGERLQSPQCQP